MEKQEIPVKPNAAPRADVERARRRVEGVGVDWHEATRAEWQALAERLLEVCPEKFDEVLVGMRDVVEAQEIISRFDWQLMHRGRPRKRYSA